MIETEALLGEHIILLGSTENNITLIKESALPEEKPAINPVTKEPALRIPDSEGNLYTIKEIVILVGRSDSWVRKAHRLHGCTTIEEIEAHRDVPSSNKYVTKYNTLVHKEIKFDRRTVCYRNRLLDKCVHYSSCQESRCRDMKHHDRYKKDGSCYTAPTTKSVQWAVKGS